ncbi:MAG: saccharopine dehydrogenase NADP-binding domain-containing protein [Myxococcales bacterium]|nr:saccharopine dehydrogenase NADP-binding domain-containing protein [Myxococcota bacterium]MDW8280229.1 saccharopine dehydrogenase NADP-binding domain-containing protein [Myxococcales bacterium]
MSEARPFDLVLLGATGFTGKLAAAYLARRRTGLRWALAGRSRARLEAVRQTLEPDPSGARPELLEADTTDLASMDRLARSARVVLTTAGPYIEHGEPVAAACVRAGTHYVDITGEPAYLRLLVDRYDAPARQRGVLLLPCCGFDSIPADLGTLFVVQRLPRGEPCQLRCYVRARGRFSGGTWASALRILGEWTPRSILRPSGASTGASTGLRGLHFAAEVEDWVLPMPVIDPLIVRRSAELVGYGPGFRYAQYLQAGSLLRAAGLVLGASTLLLLARSARLRQALERFQPRGTGPDEAVRQRSSFRLTLVGTAGGTCVVARVQGGDPGYDETAKMCVESALLLAEQAEQTLPGGVVTPAAALGERLIRRLQEAGLRFEQVQAPTGP